MHLSKNGHTMHNEYYYLHTYIQCIHGGNVIAHLSMKGTSITCIIVNEASFLVFSMAHGFSIYL